MAFILDSLRKTLGRKEGEEGFDDLNFVVGNTSGLDIGQIPSPIDQRIGRMAQIGGSVMEIQITNPATFQIDRREMLNVISQLDLDITLHGDPNIGFTAAYATRGQGVAGYNIVHRYMKRYLEQMAAFKYEIDNREDLDFTMGYVNMHASNEQIPPREERLASDVSVDPFGMFVTNINGDKKPNIYRNEAFRKKLFYYFFLEIVETPYQYYEQVFADSDDEFKKVWNKAKEKVADEKFKQQGLNQKVGLIQTVANIDQDVDIRFLEEIGNVKLPRPFTVKATVQRRVGGGETESMTVTQKFTNLKQISQRVTIPQRGAVLDSPRRISRDLYRINNQDFDIEIDVPGTQQRTRASNFSGFNSGSVEKAVEKLINRVWYSDNTSVEAKLRTLAQNADIQQSEILEKAEDSEEVRKAAAEAFSKPANDKILQSMVDGRLGDDFNKESSLFFHILPAWMQTSSENYGDAHPGWDAPEFIWESIVGEKFDNYNDYKDYLESSREHELNVIAAVGCAYIWGHYTQRKDNFTTQAFEGFLGEVEMPELKDEEGEEGLYTWSEWMNKFDLTVNIEAMYGDPGQIRRVWRPKDIAVACHAINMTAEKQSESWAEDYRGPVAKFTIDMEHTASYGVDPYQEIKDLIENEKELAKKISSIDTEKPLSEIVKTYHLTKPGWEQSQGHRHGPFARGDQTLYRWLYKMIENGFARNPDDEAVVMFEVGGEYREEMYVIRLAMDMIAEGIKPEELDPNDIPLEGDYENTRQALMARFFGLDKPVFNREWAKIEQHAFDPLKGLLKAEDFDYTWSSVAAIQNDNSPRDWPGEEYR